MDPQFEELAQHIANDVDKRIAKHLNAAEKRLAKRFRAAEKRLSNGARMNMEELRAATKLAAEGYGATLEQIERRLNELNSKWDTQISDHDKALTKHAERITALEHRR